GEAMAPMPELPEGTWGADLHADGRTIAVGTIRGEVAIAKLGDKAWKYNRRHRNYARVAWDGDSVISGSWDGSLRDGDSLLRDSSGLTPTSYPRLFAFSDGPIVATWVADGNTQYVMRATGERSELSVADSVRAVAITGETVWTGDADGRVTRVGRNGDGLEQVLPHPVHAMAVAEGASGPVAYAFEVNGACSVIDGTTMSVRHVTQAKVRDGFADVFTDDAQAAMVVSYYGDVTRVETSGAVSKVGADSAGAGVAHLDGKRVLFATCSSDPTGVMVSESPNRLLFRTQLGGFSASNPVFTRDGSRVLVGLESGAVAVVSVPDGKLIATIPVGETPVVAVYVTRDDRLVTLDKRGVVRQIAAWGANAQPIVEKKLARAGGRVVPAVWMQPAADVRDVAMDGESPDLVGVGALPLTGAPGPVVALGEAKSLIDGPDGSGSVLVQANVGKGVVFAFAHGGYLSGENIRKDANLRECMRRVVTWAHEREGAGAIVMSGAGKAVLEAIGGDVQWRTVQRDWRDALQEPGIVIVDTHQFTRAEDAAKVRAFVERGGTLITSGLAWGWLQLNPGKTIAEHPGNVALVPMGIAFADGTLDGDKDNRYPVEVREHARGRDDIDVIMRVTRGEGGIERERVEGAVARTRLALRTLTAEQAKRFIGLDELMVESAEAMQASFARMPERGLRVDRDPLALLACEQFANVSFELPAAQVTRHPSAAAFPGLVDSAAERVERVVTVDTTIPGWRATG
ncbi:MAG TPA: hypothetical protein VK157_06560, partial [Phycisphaerales bacterium]|nr:hypothetical protein [Phycisphaerales bacterium]